MRISKNQGCILLFIALVPAALGSSVGLWIPSPLRLLLTFLWVTAPMGDFVLRAGHGRIPWTIRRPMACLLGWCIASVLALLLACIGANWLVFGILLGLGNAAVILFEKEGRTADSQRIHAGFSALSVFLLLLTVIALLYVLNMGGFMAQDGRYHIGYMLEVIQRGGPGTAHPFLDGGDYDPRYSVSSYHSVLAFLSVFAKVPHDEVWFYLPAFWVILAVGGWRFFGLRVFESRPVGDLCASFFLLLSLVGYPGGPGFHELRTLAYPGGMALHILFPALIAWSWNGMRFRWAQVVILLILAITLATTHVFYLLLAVLVLCSGFLGFLIMGADRSRLRFMGIEVGIILLSAAPAILWGMIHFKGIENSAFLFDIESGIPNDYAGHILLTGGNLFILKPIRWLTLTGLNACPTGAPAIALILFVLFWTKIPREPRAFFAGVLVVVITLMSVPPLFVLVTGIITLYKSFRLFQALPVIPLLAAGTLALSDWIVHIQWKNSRHHGVTRKVAAHAEPITPTLPLPSHGERLSPNIAGDTDLQASPPKIGGDTEGVDLLPSPSWLSVVVCLALFVIAVPTCRTRLLEVYGTWKSVKPWWIEPYRDFTDPITFPALKEIASRGYGGTVLAEPQPAMAYSALFGGKVVAIPSFHASPSAADIPERLDTVDAFMRGWLAPQEAIRKLQQYRVGMAFFRWSHLSPLGEAVLASCMEEEIIIPRLEQSSPSPIPHPPSAIPDPQSAFALFHRPDTGYKNPTPVFVDMAIKDGQSYRLNRNGEIWGPSNEIVVSVASGLLEDTAERVAGKSGTNETDGTNEREEFEEDAAERFLSTPEGWLIATRAGRLLREDGTRIDLSDVEKKKWEKPIGILPSPDRKNILLLGSNGCWWKTRDGTLEDILPDWRTAPLCSAWRDPRGGILSLNIHGGVLSFGKTFLSEKGFSQVQAQWGARAGSLDMATDLALDPSGSCLYLLTRTGDVYRCVPGSPPAIFWRVDQPAQSIWLAMECHGNDMLLMDCAGYILRIPLSNGSTAG
ncbi:MAG TPA: hypothetical protein PLQ35_14295 [bacterium]|nr:hypothetical protein [bacterium]HQL63457.1 hypothetical protein [bacterium]